MKISFHCFGISITVISCMPHEKSSMIFGSRAPDPWWWHHFLGWRLGQLLSWSARSSAGRKLSDPNLRSVWHDTMLGVLCLKKKAAVLSVYLNIYWRLQNKPLFIWYIWYICIKFCFRFLKELYYPNLGRDFENFQRRNVSGFLLNQLVSWNVARRWVVKSYYIFSVRFSSPLPTHVNRNNVLLKPY